MESKRRSNTCVQSTILSQKPFAAAAAAKLLQSCPTLYGHIQSLFVQSLYGQAPPSLGFSRQEHWSGLPFPSPMHESEKWKWNRSVVSDSSRPHGLQPTRLLRPWDFPGKSTGVGCHCLLQSLGLSDTKACAFNRNNVWPLCWLLLNTSSCYPLIWVLNLIIASVSYTLVCFWAVYSISLICLLRFQLFFKFNWSIVDLQCCVNLCCTVKWLGLPWWLSG